MAKVITFSMAFPSYHPKAGQPTFFVEKFLNSIYNEHWFDTEFPELIFGSPISDDKKHHTIRAGNRWKVGDKFSPRVWGTDINPKSGRSGPYHSKQIIIAPDIEIKKVWDFEIKTDGRIYTSFINGDNVSQDKMEVVAMNDGLSLSELYNWFNKSFEGQIICWNENINY